MIGNVQETYDIVLIQPPLFSNLKPQSESQQIELEYWDAMERNAGKLLGDLPVEVNYGLISIGTYIKSFNYKVKILDFHFIDYSNRMAGYPNISEKDIIEEISKYKSKFYGISVFTIADKWANMITNSIRKTYSDSYIFWGGYYPTNNDASILRNNRNIDFVVRNEGEFIIKNILDNHENLLLDKINGITYRKNDEIIRNIPSNIIENLDELPHPDYSLYEERFHHLIVPRIYTSRGCKNNCLYCTADNSYERRIRKRNPTLVVDEIEDIVNKYNKRFFVMGDLEFLFDLDHSTKICEEIIKRGLNVKWWCQVYPPNINEHSIQLMKKAGNIQIALGIESSNIVALDEINKDMDTNMVITACKIIKKYNIQIQAYIMIGLPGDTIDTCVNTIKYVGELLEKDLIDVTHFSVMVPYPGSVLFEESEKYNIKILDRDPNKYFMNCDFLGSGIPAYKTGNMSNFEIYCVWLLALAYTQNKFLKNRNYREFYQGIYEELGLNNLSILYKYKNKII